MTLVTVTSVTAPNERNNKNWFKVSVVEQILFVIFYIALLNVLHMPNVANPLSVHLSQLMSHKHKDYPTEELSLANWVIHFAMVMIGREFTSTLRQPYNSLQLRYLGLLFALGEVSGVLFMMHHSLISSNVKTYSDQLAMHLLILGDYIVKIQAFTTGIVLLAPVIGIYIVTPVVAMLVHWDVLTFKNVPGNLLSTFSLISVLSSKSLHIIFKLAYVMASLIPALKIDTSTDDGHACTALILDVLVIAMVYGLKLKDMETMTKEKTKVQ